MESSKLPPLPSASEGTTTTGSSQSPEGSYAFLVHSQDSVSRNTPPDIDNQQLVRQKRRRTRYLLANIIRKQRLLTFFHSPEDHAILEAEYHRNSKPDKAARTDIVKRVSLGDKEVQVSRDNECTHAGALSICVAYMAR